MKAVCRAWLLCGALAAGPALAQKNQLQMNNPPPPGNAALGTSPAPVLNAPAQVPPPSSGLPTTFPPGRPPSSAFSDPVARQLNLALGLAGGLRKEASEGRAGGEGTGQLLEQLRKTLLGARDNAVAQDRTPDDEVWSRPQAEAQALVEDAARLRAQALKLQPSSEQQRILQQQTEKITQAHEKLTEASRKRHETRQNARRNIK
jgi:hypothetical protein